MCICVYIYIYIYIYVRGLDPLGKVALCFPWRKRHPRNIKISLSTPDLQCTPCFGACVNLTTELVRVCQILRARQVYAARVLYHACCLFKEKPAPQSK